MNNSTVHTINKLSGNRIVKYYLNFNHAKVKKKDSSGSEKNNSSFPVIMMNEIDEKFCITQNEFHLTQYSPCVISVAARFKQVTRDVNENSCPSVAKRIPIKGECMKWQNTEIKNA